MKNLITLLTATILNAHLLYAQRPAITQEMNIFPHQEQHVHGSSLVSLPNGDMLAAWFQGSGERNADDVRIMGARLKKGTIKWSEPFLMADTPHIPDCNPVLFLNARGKIFLIWIAVQANLWEQSILRLRTSTDYAGAGAPVWNWQDNILLKPDARFAEEVVKKFKELPDDHHGWAGYAPRYDNLIAEAAKDPVKRSIGWMTRIKPLVEPTGKILLPLYSDGFNMSMLAISEDHGSTWRPGLPIVGRGPIQPALIRKKNGNLIAFMRDSGDAPCRVHRSESADNGETWTVSRKTEIPNTASVEALTLQDGRWAFLGNDISEGRYQLTLMLSDDEGKTWKWKTYLENDLSRQGSFSYPCMIQTADGLLRITYSHHPAKGKKTIRYVTVDPLQISKSNL
ncbi:sialidase family protein [Dyadobacter sandarakinus]|uniref:Exo-alpha-sialidase n=1 Tax=Dyadobacter sandarakinus TaxID=2747268 RepID=A0ABX7I9E0_9BACT|nr:exo-alpha-sialidase [Dyadobacter sandarakinus]QRR02338.1 exo-alpha-sialidase [Dyadobacter sandarakinus]